MSKTSKSHKPASNLEVEMVDLLSNLKKYLVAIRIMKQVYTLIVLIFTIIKIPFEHNLKTPRFSGHRLPYLTSPRTLVKYFATFLLEVVYFLLGVVNSYSK